MLINHVDERRNKPKFDSEELPSLIKSTLDGQTSVLTNIQGSTVLGWGGVGCHKDTYDVKPNPNTQEIKKIKE